jgi:hypothetical protein
MKLSIELYGYRVAYHAEASGTTQTCYNQTNLEESEARNLLSALALLFLRLRRRVDEPDFLCMPVTFKSDTM